MLKNPRFYSFASSSTVSLTPFINKPASLRDLIILMISSFSLYDFVSVVMSDPKVFFWIVESVADAAPVDPDGLKTLLANGLSTFFIKIKPVFSNGPRSLPNNFSDFPVLDNCVVYKFILDDGPFAKGLGEASILKLPHLTSNWR